MSDFETAYPDLAALDPYKRVNYVMGLVLGVDEFQQEELYLLEKHRLHNRALHGYGTVCGLRVWWRDTAKGPEILVEPGVAVNPKGQVIRVPQTQCALLDDWLERNNAALAPSLGSPPAKQRIYLNLCYHECKTDSVPIPSGPCISVEDSSAPSRIADTFLLTLGFEPPNSDEEENMQRLMELLSGIDISDAPGDFLTRAQLEDRVRALAPISSPPTSPPPVTSPPAAMRMRSADVQEFMHAALRVWITEVRPQLLEAGRSCAGGPPMEGCVLLAAIEFDVQQVDSSLRVDGDVTIDERRRPLLLNSRLFQEYMVLEGFGRSES